MTPEQMAKAKAILSEREWNALQKSGSNVANKLSPQTAAQFFALYLQGYTTYEIHKQNPSYGETGFGLIVRARIEFNWDEEREKHTKLLMERTKESVERATLEAVQFAVDGMAVFHKLFAERFRKFLQTGNAAELGDFEHMTFKSYREFVELMQTLTGQNNKSQAAPPVMMEAEEPRESEQPISPDQAMEMLSLLVKDKDKQ